MDIYSIDIQEDKDILAARERARIICDELGFAITQQLQVTTSVFELGKNILEHGKGGKIIFSISTEDDTLALEVQGRDNGPGLTDDEVEDIMQNGTSTSTANRGIPAMKRLMDSFDIESAPGHGTIIRLIKKKPASAKTLAGNIVSFLQQKFTTRESPSLSQELRLQNQNLVQSLSLYEEKNEELGRTNRELLELKQQLEKSNLDLQERTAELQEALLSLGDRTSELESQNRRFCAVLQQMSEGIVVTDRSGVVVTVSHRATMMLSTPQEEIVGKSKMEWLQFLEKYRAPEFEEWKTVTVNMDKEPKQVYVLKLMAQDETRRPISCRVVPILDGEDKFIGRLWILE